MLATAADIPIELYDLILNFFSLNYSSDPPVDPESTNEVGRIPCVSEEKLLPDENLPQAAAAEGQGPACMLAAFLQTDLLAANSLISGRGLYMICCCCFSCKLISKQRKAGVS